MKKKVNLYLGDKLIAKDVEGCDIPFDKTNEKELDKDSIGWSKLIEKLKRKPNNK